MRPVQASSIPPRVSVVMSVYNGRQFLLEAVESILSQSYRDFEFVIIDDGSTDDSVSLLREHAANDQRVVLHCKPHSGLIDSLNLGFELARGTYVARMDADDIALPDRLALQTAFLDKYPEVGVVGGGIAVITASGQAAPPDPHPHADRDIKAALRRGDTPLVHPTVLIRKDAFVSVGGYRKAVVHSEDYDLWLRIAEHWQMANLPTPVLKYRRHRAQISARKFKEEGLNNLASRAAAEARKAGKPDLLDTAEEITPELFAQLGISEEMQRATIAKGYLICAQSMCDASEHIYAGEVLDEMESTMDLSEMPIMLADNLLLRSRIDLARGRIGKSVLAFCRAVGVRPVILGRPFKPAFRRLQEKLANFRSPG